jgi:hypothetical protein
VDVERRHELRREVRHHEPAADSIGRTIISGVLDVRPGSEHDVLLAGHCPQCCRYNSRAPLVVHYRCSGTDSAVRTDITVARRWRHGDVYDRHAIVDGKRGEQLRRQFRDVKPTADSLQQSGGGLLLTATARRKHDVLLEDHRAKRGWNDDRTTVVIHHRCRTTTGAAIDADVAFTSQWRDGDIDHPGAVLDGDRGNQL